MRNMGLNNRLMSKLSNRFSGRFSDGFHRTVRVAALLTILALILGACTIKPDSTVEDPLTDQTIQLPFDATATPAPTPTSAVITRAPTAAPSPAATPTPAPTVQPAPNGNYQDWNDETGLVIGTASPTAVYTPTPEPAVSAAPNTYTTLRQGMKSDEVADMQRALSQLGYYNGSIDGSFGAGTRNAVTAFQRANGLADDGIAGSKTLSLLYSGTAASGTQQAYVPPIVTAKPSTPTPKPTAAPKSTATPVAGPSTYRYL
ncbi:MAG: peptidoglycan-binding protein, partial [Oscillospiraceae bacterium]|nr:peptidoglycan-binding protein [Oscillospiraceae bacterium]